MILQWFVGYKYAHIKIIIPPAGSIWGFFFKRKGNFNVVVGETHAGGILDTRTLCTREVLRIYILIERDTCNLQHSVLIIKS